jgi:hypothetical protein
MRKLGIAIGVMLAITFAVAVLILVPNVTGPALPAGATRLQIATERPSLQLACHTALLSPVRIATDGDALVLVTVESGEIIPVVWPSGFAAWRSDGRAELAGPYGNIVGRDGDVLEYLGGGLGADDVFHICGMGLVGADR